MESIFIGPKELDMLKRALEKAGSQNKLAHKLGYSGRNAGCQINYFFAGKRKTLPGDKYERLLAILNE